MRLLTYQTADGPVAAIQVDETLVPADAVDAPASTVRGLLEALDGDASVQITSEQRAELDERERGRARASILPQCAYPTSPVVLWAAFTAGLRGRFRRS